MHAVDSNISPSTYTYITVVVHSTKEGREIKGFLLKLNASNQGSFPTTHPDNVAVGVCKEPSVSHRCPRTYGCSFGETLTFGYTSPSKPKSDVIFRYVVILAILIMLCSTCMYTLG